MANFSPKSCVFQDRASGRMIGCAIEKSGLYQFTHVNSDVRCYQVIHDSTPSRHLQIKLLHQRLGHPSFSYLRHLFPHLFRSSDHFMCEICQLAKHTRIPFPLHNYHESRPFALVHSDLWGPTRVTSISNKRWFISFIDDHIRVCSVFLLRDKSIPTFFADFTRWSSLNLILESKCLELIMELNISTHLYKIFLPIMVLYTKVRVLIHLNK